LFKAARFFAVALTMAATLGASAQAWKGMARIGGAIVDPAGKPVQGAKVVLKSVRDAAGPTVVTDKYGKWAALGLAGGQWNIDVIADGYLTKQVSVSLSEINRVPPMKIALEAAPPPEPPKEEPKEVIQVGGVEITPEVAQSIEIANAFMKEQKWAEAAAEYEKVVAVLSTNLQLKAALARAYYGAGDKKKAIDRLQEVYTADPANVTYATLLADMLLEDGKIEEGKKVLAALPPGTLTDPNTLLNLGIRMVNANKPDEAWKFFNEAVTVAPDVAAAYYYRGIAALQLKKMKEAKADLQKVISIAPDSSEAKDAKDLIAQIK
jgi:tetratricopeptide (TPR) repeat protein